MTALEELAVLVDAGAIESVTFGLDDAGSPQVDIRAGDLKATGKAPRIEDAAEQALNSWRMRHRKARLRP